MKKLFALPLLVAVFALPLFAQQKYALVIGNGAYTGSGMSRLANPVNDANDMTATLQGLGFTVDKVLDGNLDQMETAITRLKNRLSVSKNTYGFFFYAGHGVQSGGVNYLIPVGASIPSENYLRDRAVSVQAMLGELNDAGNDLNVVVLDACRDNPFAWARSGGRGLTVVGNQPADSIIVYATSAGSTASDGTGRNGLFTSQLLKNLKTPGLEVSEVFRLTGADVAQASGRKQIPAVYNQFFGQAWLGAKPAPPVAAAPVQPAPVVQPTPAPTPAPQPAPAAQPAPSVAAGAQPQRPAQTYKIGDRGPAGGFVFYDKGNNNGGWRYMEAAPVDLKTAEWGLRGEDVPGTGTAIGDGKRNTELIIAALNRKGENAKAAQLCVAYALNGYSDWFLPSKDELNEMYKNLKKRNLGGFGDGWWYYWSSSQGNNNTVWGQRFSDGTQNCYLFKNHSYSVRAVRAF
jgi:hypothetical protein